MFQFYVSREKQNNSQQTLASTKEPLEFSLALTLTKTHTSARSFICFVFVVAVGKRWQWQQQIAVFQKVQQFTWRYWNGSLFSCSNFLSSSSSVAAKEWDKNVVCGCCCCCRCCWSFFSFLLFSLLTSEWVNSTERESRRKKNWHSHTDTNGFGVRSYVMMMPLLWWWRCRWMIEPNKMFGVSRKCGFLISFKMLWRDGC